jgi:arylsulfatase A-like enzyme
MPEAIRARVPITIIAFALGAAAVSRCAAPADAPRAGPPPNVLLITIEALRPDHLSGFGYARRTTPNLDALLARGVGFPQTVTVAGRTVQSFPSILTGVIPPVHGLRYEGQSSEGLAGRMTLTRALKDHGYDAFAVTQGLNVGLHRDFDVYDPDIYLDEQGRKVAVPTRNDRDATMKALQWLRGRRGKSAPFFLWLRYVAPHWPYEAPAPYTEMFDPGYTGPHAFNEEIRPGVEHGDLIFGLRRLPQREIEHAVAHYDGEIDYTDAAVGDLIRGIDALGATARTVVLVTADHGESLGEHDYFFEHGAYLYEPTVRVPLIVVAPGVLPAGRRVETLASTIDIVPTLLELAGVPRPEGLGGESLVARALGKSTAPALPAYSESGRNFYPENPRQYIDGIAGKWRMMRDDRFKLILIPKDPQPIWEFYDLRADPGETTNVLEKFPGDVARLRAALMTIVDADPGRADRASPPLPEGLEEQLRSLGYVGGASRP